MILPSVASHKISKKKNQSWKDPFRISVDQDVANKSYHINVQRDSKRFTQFRKSIFPELYVVCE